MRLALILTVALFMAGCRTAPSASSSESKQFLRAASVNSGVVRVAPNAPQLNARPLNPGDPASMGVLDASPGDILRFCAPSLPSTPEFMKDNLEVRISQNGKGLFTSIEMVGQNNLFHFGADFFVKTAFVYCRFPGECTVAIRILHNGQERPEYSSAWQVRVSEKPR